MSTNSNVNHYAVENAARLSHGALANENMNPNQLLGSCAIIMPNLLLRRKKGRGKDRQKRKKRTCSWCENAKNGHKYACEGKGGLKFCEQKLMNKLNYFHY